MFTLITQAVFHKDKYCMTSHHAEPDTTAFDMLKYSQSKVNTKKWTSSSLNDE